MMDSMWKYSGDADNRLYYEDIKTVISEMDDMECYTTNYAAMSVEATLKNDYGIEDINNFVYNPDINYREVALNIKCDLQAGHDNAYAAGLEATGDEYLILQRKFPRLESKHYDNHEYSEKWEEEIDMSWVIERLKKKQLLQRVNKIDL